MLQNRDRVEDQALWTRGIKILLYLGLNNLAQLSGAVKYFRNVLTGRKRDIVCKSTSVAWLLVRDVGDPVRIPPDQSGPLTGLGIPYRSRPSLAEGNQAHV